MSFLRCGLSAFSRDEERRQRMGWGRSDSAQAGFVQTEGVTLST